MATVSSPRVRTKSLGTWEVAVAGVALVVAASTLVSDFAGFFTLGAGFAIALLAGFAINVLLCLSAAELSVAYPRAGALYDYGRAVFGGRGGRLLGVFLGLAFFGMFAFCASGETAAGAFGLRALLGTDLSLNVYIVVLSVLAVIPNLFGIRTTAWVSALLLLSMLGIRWLFGVAGFLGLGATGRWELGNLLPASGALHGFGDGGVLSAGLGLAFWSFVGIEFACSLAEDVAEPRRSMPRGMVFGLVGILATSLVMGLGVVGTAPLAVWQEASAGELGSGGEAPQLAAGMLMFGTWGKQLMALASVLATLSSLTVAYAALPRVIYSIARDGRVFGPLTQTLAATHRRFGTPVNATLFTFAVFVVPALVSNAVIDWLYSAAYAWIVLYVVFHGLVLAKRRLRPDAPRAFGSWLTPVAVIGILATLFALGVAFAGGHREYGSRALVILGVALAAALIDTRQRGGRRGRVLARRNVARLDSGAALGTVSAAE